MEALSVLKAVCTARLRLFSAHAVSAVVKSYRRRPLLSARAPGAVMDGPRQASSSGVHRIRAISIQHRADPGCQVSLPVSRGALLVTTSLNGVHRHGKSLALQRGIDRGTSRPLRQLLRHGSILPTAPRLFNANLDGLNFDAQSMLIEIRRGTDATAMKALARRTARTTSRPAPRPPELMRFPAIRRLAVLIGLRRFVLRRSRAAPAPCASLYAAGPLRIFCAGPLRVAERRARSIAQHKSRRESLPPDGRCCRLKSTPVKGNTRGQQQEGYPERLRTSRKSPQAAGKTRGRPRTARFDPQSQLAARVHSNGCRIRSGPVADRTIGTSGRRLVHHRRADARFRRLGGPFGTEECPQLFQD